MISDFHSHVLPGMDDGSASVAESLAMLKMEADQGVSHVVATPHFYPNHDTPETFLARRERAEQVLRGETAKHTDLPRVTVGAEVCFSRGISDWEMLTELTIGNSYSVLIEMPMAEWTDSMLRELAKIPEKQGLTPIIAHVDRYLPIFGNRDILRKLEQLPVYVQANASSFLSYPLRLRMLENLRKGRIHLLGSDCHNLHDRAPNLGRAVRYITKHGKEEAIDRICGYERILLVRNQDAI